MKEEVKAAQTPVVRPPKFIVAEVSRTWPKPSLESDPTISQKFEQVLAANNERGYELESWDFTTVTTQMFDKNERCVGNCITETIIAVFRHIETPMKHQ
jgi:hypothetical protein